MADFRNRVRVGGSGFTLLTFQSQPVAFAQQVAHTSPQPVGGGAVAIHPLDEPYPVQVITPAAAGMGSITLNLYEIYNEKVWDRLGARIGDAGNPFGGQDSSELDLTEGSIFRGAHDIADVFVRQAAEPKELKVVKYIRPPKLRGIEGQPYSEEYHGCVITNIVDGETIEIGTMEVIKQVTIAYRFLTRNGSSIAGNRAWQLRHSDLNVT